MTLHSRMLPVAALATCLFAWPERSRGAGVVISEVVADNHAVLEDEDGDYPDWIELYNAGDAEVDLTGWYLTDDYDQRTRWRFPEITIPRHGFLLVFASEKDRARPGRELHANFQVSTKDESVYLFYPDGWTNAAALGVGFRPQIEDVSYGLPMQSETFELVREGAPARAWVPADDSLGLSWAQPDFDDSSWLSGKTGVGYDTRTTYDALLGLDLETAMRQVSGSVYVRIPFEVADPSKVDALVLRMRYDDGYAAYLNGQPIASRNAPAAPTWNSLASARRTSAQGLVPEEETLFGFQGALRAGTNVLAVHGLAASTRESSFLVYPELWALSVAAIDLERPGYFESPTPGKPNGPAKLGIAETPRFLVAGSDPPVAAESGGFAQNFLLELKADSPAAAIRYTTDRTIPKESSPAYTAPISIERSTVVMARTFEEGLVRSPLVTRTYVKLGADVANFSSNLPLVVVNTFGKQFIDSQTNRVLTPVYIAFFDAPKGGRARLTDPPDYAGPAGMRYRGESSYGWPKRQYALEIRDELGYDRDAALLGLPAESDWILNGPYSDKSLMRNVLSYGWSNAIGRYAPRTRFVEMFLNVGTADLRYSHYVGVYVLTEKIKRARDRVDIAEIYPSETEGPGLTGGYIFKKDKPDPGSPGFATAHNPSLWYVYPAGAAPPVAAGEPKPRVRVMTAAQKAYLTSFLNQFESALYGANFRDPELGYAKYIDVGSFIDHHIVVELTKNIDGFRLSTYMYKDREGKLNMGPVWDYNLSLGNANYLSGWLPTGWYYSQLSDTDYPWWRRLFQDSDFDLQYRERWFELRQGPLSLERVLGTVDENSALLAEAAARNFQRWRILGRYDWPNWHIPATWEDEVQWMRNWIAERVRWMDSTLLPAPQFSHNGGAIEPGLALEITAPVGRAVYTINGPDPMDASGNPVPEAVEYSAPIVLSTNARVRARAKAGGAWSVVKEATFVVEPPPLRVTEIMYKPVPPDPPGSYSATDFEFVEIRNVGSEPIALGDARFARGISFSFASSDVKELAAGECVVVVKNPAAFASRYDASKIKVVGPYTGDLSDAGERVDLEGPLGEKTQSFRYEASWYPETAGGGRSLEIRRSGAPLEAWSDAASWRASEAIGGTPGRHEDGAAAGWQLPGDASQDGRYSVTDAARLLLMLYGGAVPPCEGELSSAGNVRLLDADGDSAVGVSDAIRLLDYLFLAGPPPALGTECVAIEGCPDACAR